MTNIHHIQPALPRYRMDFFARLARHYGPAMKVYYSPGSLGALTQSVAADWAKAVGPMRWFPGGIGWQSGVACLKLERGDIVVLSGNPRQLSTLILLARAKWRGARVIWWGHYWSSTSRRWRQVIRHLPMAIADAVLFYTDDEVAAYEANPILSRKSGVIAALNNGLDLDPIMAYRRPYLPSEREFGLLFIGRLTAKSELGLALEALALMGADAPVLHVIGDGESSKVFCAAVEQLGIGQKIIWHGAITDEAAIAAVANRCLAFLYPGQVGLSLIHGMAYGLPAIVHDVRRKHMPEIAAFRDGITGLSYARGNAASLAAAIRGLLSKPDELMCLAAGTKEAVGPSFSTEDMARRFVRLIDQLEAGS